MKYSKEREVILQNICRSINENHHINVRIEYNNNHHVIAFGNEGSSIEPYNYDCAHGILLGIDMMLQANKK